MTGMAVRRALLLVALAAAPRAAAQLTGDYQANASLYGMQLRADLLADYDRLLPPTSARSTSYSAAGTDVGLQVRFFKISSVEVAYGTMSLKVWVRMRWSDTRLTWDPAAYGGLTHTYFNGDSLGSEVAELWLPDITPYNAKEGFVSTLEPSLVRVSHTGDIFWSRPGTLDILCKFSGLANFPFDTLRCKAEFGGWALSGGVQGIELYDGGYAWSSQEETQGETYQEYRITAVTATRTNYEYDCCPNEPWPVVVYEVSMRRSQHFYWTLVLVPGILITILSFFVFMTDTGSADALGYGIGVIVVNLLSNIVLVGILPLCGETKWIDVFAILNTFFCCISLFESSLNIVRAPPSARTRSARRAAPRRAPVSPPARPPPPPRCSRIATRTTSSRSCWWSCALASETAPAPPCAGTASRRRRPPRPRRRRMRTSTGCGTSSRPAQ
jgi:hypothetical protein